MLLTLPKYKKLQSPSNIWDNLHDSVTNGMLRIQFMTPFWPELPYQRQCLYTCYGWH